MQHWKSIALTAVIAAAMTLCAAPTFAQQKTTPTNSARLTRIAGKPNLNGI